MIRYLASTAIAAALMASLPAGCEKSDTATAPAPAPMQKGDPGVPAEPYPTEEAPDPRSNGRWMVKSINTDADGSYSVMCWLNSDMTNLDERDITPAQYEEFMDVPDTGSIPCPEESR